jgi:hypothetical protein
VPARTDPKRRADGRLAPRDLEPGPTERVVLTRRATLLAAIPVVLMLGFLGLQVFLLTEQRRLIANQLELQRALTERSVPVLDAARPLVDDLREDRQDLLARARRADRLVRETTPLVRDLRAAELPEAARASRELAAAALTDDRLARTLDATLAALVEQRRLGLLRDADRAAELTPTLVELQRQALDVQRQTLVIQREALERIRSLDNKTGGPGAGALPTAVR